MLQKFSILILCLSVSFTSINAQTTNYECRMTNIWTMSNYIEFDVELKWTGTNVAKLAYFKAGIDFNYDDIANGGVLTGSFIPGSASPLLPATQQFILASINPFSHQFIISGGTSNSSSALVLPLNTFITIGRFRIDNTVNIPYPRQGSYSWSFITAANKMKTQLACYIGGTTIASDVTIPSAYSLNYFMYFTYAALNSDTINPTICSGQATNLKINFYGSEGPYTYPMSISLYNGSTYDTIVGYTNNTPIPVSPTSTTTYSISAFTEFTNYWSGIYIDLVHIAYKTVTVNVLTKPNITSSASASDICHGDNISLQGGGGSSYSWNGGVTNNIPFVPPSSSTYTVTGTGSNGCTNTSTVNISVNNCLNVKLLLQGYYINNGNMTTTLMNEGIGNSLTDVDSIEVELHESNAPYVTVYSSNAVLQTSGNALCHFPSSIIGGNYFIVIKHRNSVETWSAQPVNIQAMTSYDFSNSSNKSFGDNQIQVDNGIWAIYSGDINHDENIDLVDIGILENDISNFESGYTVTDLNGDGNVDLLDISNVEFNSSSFIYSIHP